MDLGNLSENVVYYLLIGETTCLDGQNGFPIVNALVYVIHIKQDLQ